ncbi:unnamed protein product [Dracunculus medinensis]|uniref:Solute carrier family 25 member 51 n=1 Tax=Dracunculus medinensis TaxID=318479 RepID=A0A0N4UBD1_DRAME|nr:unnamed protein product [Dracunculus medinensis]
MVISEEYADFICGCGAGCLETILLYPQSKLIFRQQLHGVFAREAIRQLRNEGFARLYRGLLPPLIMRATSRSLMFGIFGNLEGYFECKKYSSRATFTACYSSAAILAGSAEAILCPLERVQVLLQSAHYHERFYNTGHALKEVSKLGLRELYRGLSVVLIRNGFGNALFFNLREPIRNAVLSLDEKFVCKHERIPMSFIRFFADFVSGAVLGSSISTLLFPLNVVKQRMQSTLNTPLLSARTIFKIVWRERNGSIRGLFRGVHLNYTRSLITWGIANSVYEFLRRWF